MEDFGELFRMEPAQFGHVILPRQLVQFSMDLNGDLPRAHPQKLDAQEMPFLILRHVSI